MYLSIKKPSCIILVHVGPMALAEHFHGLYYIITVIERNFEREFRKAQFLFSLAMVQYMYIPFQQGLWFHQ